MADRPIGASPCWPTESMKKVEGMKEVVIALSVSVVAASATVWSCLEYGWSRKFFDWIASLL